MNIVDWIIDTLDDVKDFMNNHSNLKRWLIEGVSCVAVGVLAGVITFNVLNYEKKTLKVSEAIAATSTQEQTKEEEQTEPEALEEQDATEADSDEYEDVVIEVIDTGEYASSISDMSQEEIDAAVEERTKYLDGNKYWDKVSQYWNSKGITGNVRYCTYLADTANKVYTASDFSGLDPEVIHVIKNEMYARHGYTFKDKELSNYFMGQVWYSPSIATGEFDEKTFTETEVKNLDMLNSIDSL